MGSQFGGYSFGQLENCKSNLSVWRSPLCTKQQVETREILDQFWRQKTNTPPQDRLYAIQSIVRKLCIIINILYIYVIGYNFDLINQNQNFSLLGLNPFFNNGPTCTDFVLMRTGFWKSSKMLCLAYEILQKCDLRIFADFILIGKIRLFYPIASQKR